MAVLWLLLFPGLSLLLWGDDIYDPSNRVDSLFGLLMVGLVSLVVGLMVCLLVSEALPTKQVEHHRTPLYSLSSATGSTGSFFLGSGSIGMSLYYFYYKKLTDGGFVSGKVPANLTVVYEDTGRSEGELVVCWCEFRSGWMDWLGVPPEHETYEFRIPQGSLQPGFRLG